MKNNSVQYEVEHEPIVISKALMDTFLKQERPADLMALYMFYYMTAKWQQTNQPKCTAEYAMNGLNWTKKRVMDAKRELKELKLIQDICHIENNRIQGHFIKVNFIWSKSSLEELKSMDNSQRYDFPPGGKSQRVVNRSINALSSNNLNALSSIKEMLKRFRDEARPRVYEGDEDEYVPSYTELPKDERNKWFLPIVNKLAAIIQDNKNIKITPIQKKSWSNDFRRLYEENQVSPERMVAALEWYDANVGGEYIPVVQSGTSFREKFDKLEAGMKRVTLRRTNAPANGFKNENVKKYEIDEVV